MGDATEYTITSVSSEGGTMEIKYPSYSWGSSSTWISVSNATVESILAWDPDCNIPGQKMKEVDLEA